VNITKEDPVGVVSLEVLDNHYVDGTLFWDGDQTLWSARLRLGTRERKLMFSVPRGGAFISRLRVHEEICRVVAGLVAAGDDPLEQLAVRAEAPAPGGGARIKLDMEPR
jgi:hypothetical protein